MDKVRVLLIDDEDDVRKTLADHLKLHAEFEVVDYSNGQNALADLQRNNEEYTAVVLDWVLTPDMPGDQVLADIRAGFPQLPVMVITGKAPADGLNAMAQGAYQFLQRPINHTELINTIRNVARQDLIFWELAREVCQILNSDACLAWKLNRREQRLQLAAWAGEVDENPLQELRLNLIDMVQKRCFHHKEPLCFRDIRDAEEIDQDYQQEAVRQGWTSLICTPLFYRGQLIGLLDSFTYKRHSCETDMQQNIIKVFLQAYAHQSAAAIRNAHLTGQLHALNEINKLLAGIYEEKAIIQQILGKGLELVGSNIGWIYSINQRENKLNLEAWQGPPEIQIEPERILGAKSEEGVTGYVARKGEVLNIRDVDQDKRHKSIDKLNVKSEVAVPLRRGEKIIGVLTVKSPFPNAFSSDDEDVLTALAAQAVVVIERARLTNHLQQVSQLALTEDVRELLTYVVNAVHDLTGAEAAFWMMSEREREGDKFLRIKECTSGIPKTYMRNAKLSTDHGRSIHVLAWEEKRPHVKNDVFDGQEPIFQNITDAKKHGWRSFMVVPLLGQADERLGTLSLYGKSLGQFKQLEIESVQAFANQVAITLQQQKRTSALRQLAQISQTVTERMTDHPKKLLEKVAQLARNLTEADCVVIYPYDPGKKQFYDIDNIAAVGLKDPLSFVTNKPRKTGFASFIRKKKAVVVHDIDAGNVEIGLEPTDLTNLEDVAAVQKILADAKFIKRENIKAFVGIPLRARGKEKTAGKKSLEVGILYINFRAPHHFSPETLQTIDIYAHHVANVVWSARLYTAEQRQASELEAVRQTALRILTQEEDLDGLLRALVKEATKLLKGIGGKVYIRVPGKEQVELLAAENVDHNIEPLGYTINFGEGMAGRVIQTKKPLIVSDYANWEGKIGHLAQLFGAVIEVPMMRGEEALGVLAVFDDADKRQFTEDDFPILERLAQQAALAIHNTNLVNMERTLREQSETLREVSSIISADLDLKEVTSRILDELRKVIAYNKSTIQLIRGDSRELIAYCGFTESEIDNWLLRPLSQDHLVACIVESKEPLILSNLQIDAPNGWEIRKDTEDVMSWVGLPLVFGDETIGLMTLDCQQPDFYTSKDRGVLTLFANQAAIAIQNARLYEGAQYRIRDLEIVSKVVREIGPKLEINDLLQTIVAQIADHLHCTHCTIFFPEYKNGQTLLVPKATYGKDSRKILDRRFLSGEGVAGWVYAHGESLMLNNATEDPRFVVSRQKELLPRSLLVVPIKSEGKTIGVLSADQDKLDWFDERGKQLVETLVNHAAIAIQNAQFVRQDRAIREVAGAISANLQMHEVTERILDALYKVIEYHNAGIQLIQGGQQEQIAFRSHVGKKSTTSIARSIHEDPLILSVLTNQEPLILSDTGTDPRFDRTRATNIGSWACVPLIFGLEVVGTMTLDHQRHGFYIEEMKDVLILFADQAAIAIQNVLYFEKLKQPAEELQRSRDTQIAAVGEIARSIAGRANLDAVLNGILDSVVSLIRGVKLVEVHLLNKETNELVLRAFRGFSIDKKFQRMSTNVGITGWVIRNKQSLIIPDVVEDERYVQVYKATRSEMAIPLLQESEAIGVLNIEHSQVNAFSDKDRQLAEAIAGLTTVAMQNARQFRELVESDKRFALLQEITSMISFGSSALDEVLRLVVENLCKIFDDAHCVIGLYDAASGKFDKRITAAAERMKNIKDHLPRRNGISQYVVGTGVPYFVQNARIAPPQGKPNISEELVKQGLQSSASFPLLIENQVIGVLYLNLGIPHQFSQNDKHILSLFADQAAIAIWNIQQRNRRIQAIQAKYNPYIVGPPIHAPDVFFGRKKLLEEIMGSIHNNHFLIYGERRIGKTSLLIQLSSLLRDNVDITFRFVPVLSSLEGIAENQFFGFLMKHIIDTTRMPEQGLRWKSEFDYNHYDFEEDFEKVIKHLQHETPDKEIRIVLLLDEMDQFADYAYTLHQQFRSLFTAPGSVYLRMVMTGVHIQRLHQTRTSPWYNLFKEIELKHFEESEARQLLVETVRGYYTYEPEALLSILEYSDLKPLEVQRLGYFTVNAMLDRVSKSSNEVSIGDLAGKPLLMSKEDVLQGVDLTLQEKNREYPTLWQQFSDEQRKALLKAIAQGGVVDIAATLSDGNYLFSRGELHNISRVDKGHIKLMYLFMQWIRSHQ